MDSEREDGFPPETPVSIDLEGIFRAKNYKPNGHFCVYVKVLLAFKMKRDRGTHFRYSCGL